MHIRRFLVRIKTTKSVPLELFQIDFVVWTNFVQYVGASLAGEVLVAHGVQANHVDERSTGNLMIELHGAVTDSHLQSGGNNLVSVSFDIGSHDLINYVQVV